MCTTYMPGAHGGQNRASSLLELVIGGYKLPRAGNQIAVLPNAALSNHLRV